MSQTPESIRLPESPLSTAVSVLLAPKDAAPDSKGGPRGDNAPAPSPTDRAGSTALKKKKATRLELKISAEEHQRLAALKDRAAHLTGPIKKSALLRAGILSLSRLGDDGLTSLLAEFHASEKQAKKHARKSK